MWIDSKTNTRHKTNPKQKFQKFLNTLNKIIKQLNKANKINKTKQKQNNDNENTFSYPQSKFYIVLNVGINEEIKDEG